jgi:ubiquitin carboxyl-terminal hydrolase 5/13
LPLCCCSVVAAFWDGRTHSTLFPSSQMDPDFNDPLPEDEAGGSGAASSNSSSTIGVDEAVVQSLAASLGAFTVDQVRAALRATSGAPDRAADWLFSHMDDLHGAIAALEVPSSGDSSTKPKPKIVADDGDGKYQLCGMISHIGKNTGSGHYVCHLKKDGKWVIFNDEKVALSSKPPFPHAYIYLYQRCDTVGRPGTDHD